MINSITYKIDTLTCGDNSDADNQRYALAVRNAIKAAFRYVPVNVELSAAVPESANAEINSDSIEEIDLTKQKLNEIANHIWDKADY